MPGVPVAVSLVDWPAMVAPEQRAMLLIISLPSNLLTESGKIGQDGTAL